MNRMGGTSGIKSLVISISGVFLFVVAVILDVSYLYIMAMTLFLLPLVSYGLTTLLTPKFSARRDHPPTVTEGQWFTMQLQIAAQGRGMPQAMVHLLDTLPEGLSPDCPMDEPHAVETWDGREGTFAYRIDPQKRGVYTVGPARLENNDPLGLFLFTSPLATEGEVVVHPEPLPSRQWLAGGDGIFGLREREGRARKGEGQEMHGVREYRPGDPLRRVHWRTSARTGRLAVVEYERAFEQDVIIGLDLTAGTDCGSGRESTLEYAVKIAATLAHRTLVAGGGVTLVTQMGKVVVRSREGDPQAAEFRLMDHLARVTADSALSLAESLRGVLRRDSVEYIVITASGDPALSRFLSDRVVQGDRVHVYFIEPGSFGGHPATTPAVAGATLTVVEKRHSPWNEGGKRLEYLLR